ncbi:hypothetical protein GCM10018772_70570 [Streptomyces fumanus]|uniref:Uncharacterized protein n=1 Tax=Streptomyces fumanus TaxID=67302 RepID=A0A919EAH1_9ACTN|nr:hypothetical protein [Streptomyces fumanus]GHF34914.1 hypothetical protein GCM10018772_70570 [Streptomyces fumanus]
MIAHVDPAVTSALIAAPVAVLAAGAAYAAGRLQARGAHHGPIDAVRRQHQRDAYAALLQALREFASATDVDRCNRQAYEEFQAAGVLVPDLALQAVRVCQLLEAAPIEPVRAAFAVVELEGPESVTESVRAAHDHAEGLVATAAWGARGAARRETVNELYDDREKLDEAIRTFTAAAQEELNRRP